MTKKTKHNDKKTQVQENNPDEWKNKYLRALADYHNLEKRVEENRDGVRKRATQSIIIKLLDIMDTIDTAEVFVKDAGLKIVKDQFKSLLAQEGVSEIDVLNKEYDPYTSECTEVVTGDRDNIVFEIIQKGYKQYKDVIRPARVKVTKKL